MKNLIFKELKLSMHPLIFIFVVVFPLMVLIPSYPLFISFIYICTGYPILFLGTQKGQQSNDILYSCLLPIRKKDVIKARMITLLLIQLGTMLIMAALAPIAYSYRVANPLEGTTPSDVGFSLNGLISLYGFVLVAFSVYDYIYLTCFYKNGRSVLFPTFFGLAVFILFLTVTTIVFPLVFPGYYDFFCNVDFGVQLLYLLVGIVVYALIHYAAYKKASYSFDRVDL